MICCTFYCLNIVTRKSGRSPYTRHMAFGDFIENFLCTIQIRLVGCKSIILVKYIRETQVIKCFLNEIPITSRDPP